MTGIYGILNKITGKWYVGQAVDIARREKQERAYLAKGSFHGSRRNNEHMVASWKAYGPDAFEWHVLEKCKLDELDEREVFWIKQKDSYHNGYNQTVGGGGRRGYHLTEETKRKLSKSLKGRSLPEETRQKMRVAHIGHQVTQRCRDCTRERSSIAVEQIYDDGSTRVWASATAAASALGIYQSNITKCCRGKLSRTGGFRWRYA